MAGHRLRIAALFATLTIFASGSVVYAQRSAASVSALPTPNSVLGFTPGDDRKIADWSQITDYFTRLDKASDRVLVKTLGKSTLDRPLIAAFISARENLINLEKIRQIQSRLADPRTITGEVERKQLLNQGKVVVAVSCSIHSTEIVASQMSMQLAYELAAAQDLETREILQNTVLILIPSPNPDGVDIVANWYRKTLGTSYEGSDPPELYHHYAGHDDNRDWFMLNLKETLAITRLLWKEWFPQIVYDVHQQGPNGSRFFVPPFFDPPNPNIDPLLLREVGLLGHKIAADLQAAGSQGVITNSAYDTWWHGGFRTAPYFHNSIGILSEAASARLMTPTTVTKEQLQRTTSRGMRSALERATNFPDPWTGGAWRPRDIANLEMTATRSILTFASRYRHRYLNNFLELAQKNLAAPGRPEEPLAYLIPAGQGKDESVAKLVSLLINQNVEVFRLDQELHAGFGPQILQRTNSASEKLGNYRTIIAHTSGLHEVPAGSYIIFTAQPQRRNVLALFEPQIYPNRVTAAEVERPYDVAGWTIWMQIGIEAPAVVTIQEPAALRRLTLINNSDQVRTDLALRLSKNGESPIVNPVGDSVRIGLYRPWTANMDEGWTRFVFDTFNVPYKTVRDAEIRRGQLGTNFDVIVLASQRIREIIEGNASANFPAEYTGGITQSGVDNLKAFVEQGGTLVCFDGACELPIKHFNLPIRNVLEGERNTDFYCPGSIVALELERSAPLARGLASPLDAFFTNSSAFETSDPSVKIIARYAKENVLRSGWLLGEQKLRGRIALAEVPLGRGRLVLFAFRPQHRGQTWATLPLIWNALRAGRN
jgi:zinc carboxypeptidase